MPPDGTLEEIFELRQRVTRGSIDVNIMTKLDRDRFAKGKELGPKFSDALASTTNMTVNSLSSTYRFTYGWPVRAVTFQSMVRISSPGTYSRTSSKFIPLPLNTD